MFSKKLYKYIGKTIFIQVDTSEIPQVEGVLQYIDKDIIILKGDIIKTMIFPSDKIIAMGINYKDAKESSPDTSMYA